MPDRGRLISFHGQDDLGLATASSLAAIAAGARQVEVDVNAIGERAGNTSLEEVVLALRVHGGALGVPTGWTPRACSRSRKRWPTLIVAVPPNKAMVGGTPSGTPRASTRTACSSRRETYEVISGLRSATPWAARSCWHALGAAGSAARVAGARHRASEAGARARVRAASGASRRAGESLTPSFGPCAAGPRVPCRGWDRDHDGVGTARLVASVAPNASCVSFGRKCVRAGAAGGCRFGQTLRP